MNKSTIIQVSPNELANLISEQVKADLQQFATNPKVKELEVTNKPHLTRKETASFFDVSLNCINDWSKKGILKPIKVGQRTYFRKSDLLDIMFNQLKK
jgi:hypothetical protein